MTSFQFTAHDDFVNRHADLRRLNEWWASADRNALALYGRRRVGKSWLFRELAHEKPALVLVADRRSPAPQLDRFADQLAPYLGGVRPRVGGVAELIATLYSIATEQKLLAIIDEFPYLLPARDQERDATLTEIQAVMEERDASALKLVLCGSHIGQVEQLLRGPLRGRLTALNIEPLTFADAQAFASGDPDAIDRIQRYAVTGGMSLYLDQLGRGGTLRKLVCERVLDPRGALFNDPREILEEELRAPSTYYSLLEELSKGSRSLRQLATVLGRRTTDLPGYLDTLCEMRLVQRFAPITARDDDRNKRYRLDDDFLRFWFRFVFPFQEELKTGLPPQRLFDDEIAPCLAEHVSPTFEALCRRWLRQGDIAGVSRVGRWWGNALNELRHDGRRSTEEVDVVALHRGAASVVGECKWTSGPMGVDVLTDLEQYKVPAMRQGKVRFTRGGPRIVLFAKAGFKRSLVRLAAARDDVRLVRADEVARGLLGS